MYQYNAKITNVVDGDTFDMDIDLGFYTHIHVRTRLLEVDTPEKRGSKEKELGLIVTEYASKLLTGKNVVIESKGLDQSPNTDSFGRWLVKVYLDSESLAETYNKLGVNKLNASYSVENVTKLVS
mgnify:CR=1 FL=1